MNAVNRRLEAFNGHIAAGNRWVACRGQSALERLIRAFKKAVLALGP